MDKSSKEIIKGKQSTSKISQARPDKIRNRSNKRAKGQKDIRTLIKNKKNELLTYTKDFDLICKQSGIDVDPEQLQLAIALSKSLQDNTQSTDYDKTKTENLLTCNQRKSKIRATLQEFGFQVKKSGNKVKKYKKHYKLILVSDIEKHQRIADKYAQILINNICNSKVNERSLIINNIKFNLYNLATNVSYDNIKDDEIFYVDGLIPKCLNKKHIFNDWSKIPGRPVSPQLERPEHSFKDTKCSSEELDILLSGSIEIAQNIIKKNYRSKSFKSESIKDTLVTETEINQHNSVDCNSKEDLAKVCSENKTTEHNLISSSIDVLSYSNTCNMSPPTNRSCSPDLFDDEVTIIMDSPKDKISDQEGVSETTMMVKEQNDFMELTNCITTVNGVHIDSKHVASFSQGKTMSNSNDFMDLTECVPACSQKILNNLKNTSSYERNSGNCSEVKKNNHIKVIDLNERSKFIDKIKSSSGNGEKLLDDSIIVIGEDCNTINIGKKYNVARSCSKDNVIIDLVEEQYKSSGLISTIGKCSDSIDLEQSTVNNVDNSNFDDSNPRLKNSDNSSTIVNATDSIGHLDMVDLTQPCNFEDCLSFVNVHSVKSNVAYEIHDEFNSTSSRNSDHNKTEKENDSGKDNDEILEKCQNVEMDLTQSSNSEDYIHEVCINNKSLDDTIILDEHYNSVILLNNDLGRNDNKVDCVNLVENISRQGKHYSNDIIINSTEVRKPKTSTEKNIPTIFDTDNDCEYDNLMENMSKSKEQHLVKGNSFNLSDNGLFQSETKNQVLDLTQNYNFLSGKSCSPKNKIGKLNDNAHRIWELVNDDSSIVRIDGENRKIMKNSRKLEDTSHNSGDFDINHEFDNVHEYSSETKRCSIDTPNSYCENEDINNVQYENLFDVIDDDHDIQNCDIDLTQKSDCSEHTLCSEKIIEVPDELGKRNNISVDYDKLCGKEGTRDTNTTSFNINQFVENNYRGSKDKDVSASSQHSEVFELSDNEFNYSINQHVKGNDSLTPKETEFNIGGVSIIDEFLNRKSFPRKSNLRCSCSAIGEPVENNDESCLPVVNLKNNENLISNNINEESKSCEEVQFVNISTPLKSKSDDNILIAKTPIHDDYMIRTAQVTPMPNYENMSSPERNEELDKFGIKPLKRKRAIQILTHIYNQTHPLMEVISNDDCPSPSKIRRKNTVASFPRRVIASQIDCIMVTSSAESSNQPKKTVEANLSQKSRKGMSKNSQKSPEKRYPRACTKNSSKENVYEETTSVPDIRNIECSPEDWVFQKREKAKVHACRVPLHIAFHNYVSCRKALREAILRYEPINIDDIHKGLVAIGYRYNPKDLLKFMDRKCITVKTADNSKKCNNT